MRKVVLLRTYVLMKNNKYTTYTYTQTHIHTHEGWFLLRTHVLMKNNKYRTYTHTHTHTYTHMKGGFIAYSRTDVRHHKKKQNGIDIRQG